ncbi:hypothetical protein FGLOB1_9319 [Fusarium globosum]|uniref:Uncharacterized protein n=1 Tax=Fusarium globosum TaxID=78864 RepID=A0A8H5Y0F8_9HYPO|nr:hypothetical protein FGLOB1_9319 [Fusarium globosum]
MKFRFVDEDDPATLHRRRLQAQHTQRCRQRQKAGQRVETTNHQAESSQTVESATENVQTGPENSSLADTGETGPDAILFGELSNTPSQEDEIWAQSIPDQPITTRSQSTPIVPEGARTRQRLEVQMLLLKDKQVSPMITPGIICNTPRRSLFSNILSNTWLWRTGASRISGRAYGS